MRRLNPLRGEFALVLIAMLAGCGGGAGVMQDVAIPEIPSEFEQLILVTTPSWTITTGTLRRYDRSAGAWKPAGPAIPVRVGRTGLAWGSGLNRTVEGRPRKSEGDGKSPAGAFLLGTAFGYDSQPPAGVKLAYRQATARDYWVDDAKSADYNMWVSIPETEPNDPSRRWQSAEKMRRDDELYELGVVVEYNTRPVTAGLGSAIFLHVGDTPTDGCTAMKREEMLALMLWLDPSRKPVLIQAPAGEVQSIRFH